MFVLADGKQLWKQPLPAKPATWGWALDRAGPTVLTLQDGRMAGLAR